MKNKRRDFLRKSIAGTAALTTMATVSADAQLRDRKKKKKSRIVSVNKPLVVSTWNNLKANEAAWNVLKKGGSALDAVEQGVMVPEADVNDMSVGYGGRPDREGNVTLDSCIMDHYSNCGSVMYLQHIMHPVSVARKVMENTPHIILLGQGALQFALESGFKKEDLLTDKAKKEWEKWLEDSKYAPVINIENHDTIGMVTLDSKGELSGACTTSGAAYKMNGRVGDSPVIGAGLFVDGDIGAATATGLGEAVIKVAGSHLVVELMRQGMTPNEACKAAVERVIKKEPKHNELQVGFLAINKDGEYGGYSIQKGFMYAVYDKEGNRSIDANFALKS